MLPFCGYNMGDYLQHWLDIGKTLRVTGRPPRIFHVNWFQKDSDGKFLWPGFGENSRVLEWIVDRLEGRVAARETPIGWLPKSLNTRGLDLSEDTVNQLLKVDPELLGAELDDAQIFLAQFGDRLPETITRELLNTRKRLET
jgi:phosphoenolpyruvate carboxykinase (GTP)